MNRTRIAVVAVAVFLAAFAGCKEEKKSDPAAGGAPAAEQPSGTETPPADPGTATAPEGGGAPAGGGAADPAKVEEAANTALKIMAVVSSAVRGAKGDCARMGQSLAGVMTVAQKWRDELAEQYKEPGVRQGVKSALGEGKFPELRMNLMATRDGAKACPDQAPEFEKVLAEIH